jgi:phage gp36-like protein
MTPLVSVKQFFSRIPQSAIMPQDAKGKNDGARIETALRDATGIITAHLPWLLDKGTGEVALPVTPQFADALNSICTDIALYRLTDSVSGSEDAREKYRDNMTLLNKINREYQGGLEGPGLQSSEVVTPNAADGITDGRFFKKGGMY